MSKHYGPTRGLDFRSHPMSRLPSLRISILSKGIVCLHINYNHQEVYRAAGPKENTNAWYAAHWFPPLHHVSIVLGKYPRPRANIVRAMETSRITQELHFRISLPFLTVNVWTCRNVSLHVPTIRPIWLDIIHPRSSNVHPILPIPTRLSTQRVKTDWETLTRVAPTCWWSTIDISCTVANDG